MNQFPALLLTGIVWGPFVAVIVVMFLPERNDEERSRVRLTALAGAGFSFFLATFFAMLSQIGLAEGGGLVSAFEENHRWINSFSFVANYHLTADGITLPLLVLSTIVFGCAIFHSWRVRERVRLYVALLLLLQTATNGVLCSADFLLFLVFWGMQIVPLYVLIRVWGGAERRRAADRYLVFMLVSLALLVAAVLLVIFAGNVHTSDIPQNVQSLAGAVETAGFWLSFAAFAIAMGVFPAHRWMVEAHGEASAGVAAVASGVLLTLAGYGLIRITLAVFPHASHQFSLAIAGLAVVSALWGSVSALNQDDLRRFVAYMSVPQMALVLLAVGTQTSIALEGAVLLLLARGFSSAMLMLLSGAVEERTRTRSIRALGGLAELMPRIAGFWLFAVLTLVGVPLLAGFVAEFMLFTGAFPAHRIATVMVMATTVLATGGLLWVAHRVFYGPARETFARARDATTLELTYLIPLVAAVLFVGIRAGALTPVISNGVLQITTRLSGG
jgi:NADH-quinone oxidoreductase subunit M